MAFMDLAKSRYSVRKFSDKPIEKEKLDAILEAGRIAPTGHNYQPYRVYVLQSAEALEKIRGLTRCAFNAPVVLMVTVRKDEEWVNPFEYSIRAGEQDASIVATHMMLEAWDLGIGSCWVNFFPVTKTADAFQLELNEVPLLLLPIGYAAAGAKAAPQHAQRRSNDEPCKGIVVSRRAVAVQSLECRHAVPRQSQDTGQPDRDAAHQNKGFSASSSSRSVDHSLYTSTQDSISISWWDFFYVSTLKESHGKGGLPLSCGPAGLLRDRSSARHFLLSVFGSRYLDVGIGHPHSRSRC